MTGQTEFLFLSSTLIVFQEFPEVVVNVVLSNGTSVYDYPLADLDKEFCKEVVKLTSFPQVEDDQMVEIHPSCVAILAAEGPTYFLKQDDGSMVTMNYYNGVSKE